MVVVITNGDRGLLADLQPGSTDLILFITEDFRVSNLARLTTLAGRALKADGKCVIARSLLEAFERL